jgi:hypothetical protein
LENASSQVVRVAEVWYLLRSMEPLMLRHFCRPMQVRIFLRNQGLLFCGTTSSEVAGSSTDAQMT